MHAAPGAVGPDRRRSSWRCAASIRSPRSITPREVDDAAERGAHRRRGVRVTGRRSMRYWDLRVWLEIDDELSVAARHRTRRRDGRRARPRPRHSTASRYLVGERLYIDEVDPRSFVDVIVDNTDFDRPAPCPPRRLTGGQYPARAHPFGFGLAHRRRRRAVDERPQLVGDAAPVAVARRRPSTACSPRLMRCVITNAGGTFDAARRARTGRRSNMRRTVSDAYSGVERELVVVASRTRRSDRSIRATSSSEIVGRAAARRSLRSRAGTSAMSRSTTNAWMSVLEQLRPRRARTASRARSRGTSRARRAGTGSCRDADRR